jgi:hypothetical protein
MEFSFSSSLLLLVSISFGLQCAYVLYTVILFLFREQRKWKGGKYLFDRRGDGKNQNKNKNRVR